MASTSFIPPQPHWMPSNGLQHSFAERRNSAVDASVSSPFNFVPQEMPRKAPPKRAPPPLPAFSFPQASDSSHSSAPSTAGYQNAGGYVRRDAEQAGEEPASAPALPTPASLPPPGPGLSARGPGRRGHAHRRSAAMSSVDLTAITKAFPPKPVNGSAPSTPVDTRRNQFGNEEHANLTSRSFPNMKPTFTPPITPRKSDDRLRASPQLKPEIPEPAPELCRPLSVISSESTVSTVRPTNSHTDGTAPSTGTVTPTGDRSSRPKTAGANLDLGNFPFVGSKDDLTERPHTASAAMALSNGSSESVSNPMSHKPFTAVRHPLCNSMLPEEIPSTPQRAPSSRKPNKKQKKMRSWAGILTRKGKKKGNKRPPSRRAPTPPPVLTRTNSQMSFSYGVDFDEDNTIVIRTPTDPNAPRRSLPAGLAEDSLSLDTSWKPQSFYEQARELDMFSPVIDLDAALGPFNTPEMGPERPVTGFSAATRRMYSGGRRGEFVGPEMRYHRRAESAPEMPPFDRSGLGLNRYSTAAMLDNDVFDEKEEDEFLAETNSQPAEDSVSAPTSPVKSNKKRHASFGRSNFASSSFQDVSSFNPGLGIQIVDIADELVSSSATTPQTIDSRPSTALALTPCTPDMDIPSLSMGPTVHMQKKIAEIPVMDDWPPQSDESSKASSICSSTGHEDSNSAPTNVSETNSPAPLKFRTTVPTPEAEFPSPALSATSFDPPRLATPSSMAERQTISSVYSGEPGSACFHNSVDDVPSLTSSASTMTSTLPRLSSGFYPKAAGDRSSFSTSNLSRPNSSYTTKRSSLVSLSKLVGVASAERSKLSQEQKAPADEVEKKKKKGNRISRLMHFWKNKEKQKDTRS